MAIETLQLKNNTIVIDENEPFKHCALGREQYAIILEKVIGTFTDGCVLSLNGEWGTGKTTFLQMWRQQLINNGFDTIYFNAWETDYISDPIIGLIGELKKLSPNEEHKAKLQKVISTASKLIGSAIPTLIKGVAEQHFGENGAAVLESIAKGGEELFQKEIEQYEEESKSITAFRDSLASFVASRSHNEKPLIFFIDELDRCNPHYAVKVLERIKHLFSIPQIIFVLSIDKEQFSHSICGYYGSEKINAKEYLRRFIDIEYNLPLPDYDKYFDYLITKMNFLKFFARRGVTSEANGEYSYFSSIAKKLYESKELSLRQMEKIMLHTRLALQTFYQDYKLYPNLVILTLYFRFFEPEIYSQIEKRELSAQDLITALENKLPNSFINPDAKYRISSHNTTTAIAGFIFAYDKDDRESAVEKIIDLSDPNKPQLKVRVSKLNEELLIAAWKYYTEGDTFMNVPPLHYIIDHIELTSNFQQYA